MYNPVSTYRLQFHKEFTFAHFKTIIPYLKQLGIAAVYASPVFQSRTGSTHGYDALNPHQIDPEIGTAAEIEELITELQELEIGWVQDIVPNHMAFSSDNPWLMDVLEKGQQSVFASFFDINWSSSAYPGKLMAPFLGATLQETVSSRGLSLDYREGRFVLRYFDAVYPLNPRSYERILSVTPGAPQSVEQLAEQMPPIHQIEDPDIYAGRWDEFLLQLSSLMKNPEAERYLRDNLQRISNDPDALLQLAEEQNYVLCHWQDTDGKINFRRFFTVNGLICLNMQNRKVFEHFHQYIAELMEKGLFKGLRIDHIDGLYDPSNYLNELRELVGEEPYIVVEKILGPGEQLSAEWPVQGTTGYDFLGLVNNVLTKSGSEKEFTRFYERLLNEKIPVQRQIHDKKACILNEHMGGELENLYQLFIDLKLTEETELPKLKEAIAEFLIQCPVYRFYGNRLPLSDSEAASVSEIFNKIRKTKAGLSDATELLERMLIKQPLAGDEDYNQRALQFYQRLMQFTGPLMAKGIEDTVMYTYNRFAGHNEVGDSPEAFGTNIEDFHHQMKARQQNWPLTMNASATHDTKRGEDVRARLNVLTELPEVWFDTVSLWSQLNAGLKQDFAPDKNDEYFIYQNLLGAYPMPGQNDDNFNIRFREYLQKALREAKQHSNWAEPNTEYEEATNAFIAGILDKSRPFWKSFESFHKKIADYGICNSLAQLLLKFTCPGVPDTYQGCELWDFSLVDPDNRRPVDFQTRAGWLSDLSSEKQNRPELIQDLWQNRFDGKIKLWLSHVLMTERKLEKEVFEHGEYIPLKVKGKYKENILAFARHYGNTWYVIVLPLHTASLCRQRKKSVLNLKWKKTRVLLPDQAPQHWKDLLLGNTGKTQGAVLLKDLFGKLPLALLKLQQPQNNRGAGILLHISSLPSAFGTGDFGPEAYAFADFLHRSKQKYWQILPLSPTGAAQGYSPYSALSSMAGNSLLISPEMLVKEGLLSKTDIREVRLSGHGKANFQEAERIKEALFDKAYCNFSETAEDSLLADFQEFCEKEAYWLDSFAMYMALKQQQGNKPWYEWPRPYMLRDEQALQQFGAEHAELLQKTRFLQFVFMKQWTALKSYCNKLNIQLFGDLPFYVSYDSADVWSHPELFELNEEGMQTGTSGVPPDYFNENGQLWGMPIFRWDVLKERQYDWWISRIKKNIELFDLLRLDHFRAFSNYWVVPAGEETAKKGEWVKGPGADFFRVLEKTLGKLPFVAEDLGDIDQPVYELRDQFRFPGMKVLQFAFGENMPGSIDIPHNYSQNAFAYTGTHDNNTTAGWFNEEAGKSERKNISAYTGIEPDQKNIHLILARMLYSSVARVVILPLQDVLGLDARARMNTPASARNNWSWRLTPGLLSSKEEKRLRKWTELFNRA